MPPEPRMPAIVVDLVADSGDWTAFEPTVATIDGAVAALNAELGFETGPADREAVVALADDATLRRLNLTFRGKDAATNVLSFPVDDSRRQSPADNASPLGDVVLAAETLLREASEFGIPPTHHLTHMVVHGLLHLLGHDHDHDSAADRMEALETAILARLGIADPNGDPLRREPPAPVTHEEDRQSLPTESR